MPSNSNNRLTPFFFALAITALYFPALGIQTMMHDDWVYYWNGILNSHNTFKDAFYSDGRIVQPLLQKPLMSVVSTISDAKYLRLVGILQIAILSYGLYWYIRWDQLRVRLPFLLSVLICALPAFQVSVIWLTQIPQATPVLLGLLSAIFVAKATNSNLPSLAVLSLLILLTGLHMYEPAALFYWVPIGLTIAFAPVSRWVNVRKRVFWSLGVGFTAMLLRLLSGKILLPAFAIEMSGRTNTVENIMQLLGRFRWFLSDPLVRALNYWAISPSKLVAIILFSLIALGIGWAIFTEFKNAKVNQKVRQFVLEKNTLLILLVLISFIPNLAVQESYSRYRTHYSLTPLLLIFAWISVSTLGDLIKAWLGKYFHIHYAMLPVCLYMVYSNINYSKTIANRELELLTEQAHSKITESTKHVHILLFDQGRRRIHTHLEFGYLGTTHWDRAAIGMLSSVLSQRTTIDPRLLEITAGKVPISKDSGAVTIDMTSLREQFPDPRISYYR